MTRRVVVTGLGMTTPLAETTAESWQALLAGRSGIRVVPEWLRSGREALPATIAGVVPNFDPVRWLPSPKELKRTERFIHLSFAAAHQAWLDSGLPPRLDDASAPRAGALIGVGLCGMQRLLDEYDALRSRGPFNVSAYGVTSVVSNMAPAHVAIRYNMQGPNFAIASACASGSHAIAEALLSIRSGRCDLMLTGGAEAPLTDLAVSSFASTKALCVSHNDDPEHASRPFDRSRDGFVLGEGAGMLVLEELSHARARGARIYAELAGQGSSCDALHVTLPAPGGAGAARAMREALASAELNPSEIGYVNAHGTATQVNDRIETEAIKAVFGPHAPHLMVSSTKSMTGHLLGGAGGVEAVITALAVAHGALPPTINYHKPDPACDLDYIPNVSREQRIDAALSNCFGFGGTNSVLAFRRFRD